MRNKRVTTKGSGGGRDASVDTIQPLLKFKPQLIAKSGGWVPPVQGIRPSEEKKAEQERRIGEAGVKT
jgi:hypothetical protein